MRRRLLEPVRRFGFIKIIIKDTTLRRLSLHGSPAGNRMFHECVCAGAASPTIPCALGSPDLMGAKGSALRSSGRFSHAEASAGPLVPLRRSAKALGLALPSPGVGQETGWKWPCRPSLS